MSLADGTLTSDDSLQYMGLTNDSFSASYMGDLGDGSGQPSDWLSNALSYIQQGANAAASVVSAANGKTVPNGSVSQPLSTTAGPIQGQNKVASSISKIPTWLWVVGGLIVGGGLIAAFWPKKKGK